MNVEKNINTDKGYINIGFKCPYYNEEKECNTLSNTNPATCVDIDKDNLILKLIAQNGQLIEALQKGGMGRTKYWSRRNGYKWKS